MAMVAGALELASGAAHCVAMKDAAERCDSGAMDEHYMRRALVEARAAAAAGEVPVGAVIVHEGRLIGRAHNQVERLRDPTAHAEILAITQAAAALGDWRLTGAAVYVTKEPCAMCAGALVLARVARVVWGADDPQRGGAVSKFRILDHGDLNHRCQYARGVLAAECLDLLRNFFREQRGRERGLASGRGGVVV